MHSRRKVFGAHVGDEIDLVSLGEGLSSRNEPVDEEETTEERDVEVGDDEVRDVPASGEEDGVSAGREGKEKVQSDAPSNSKPGTQTHLKMMTIAHQAIAQ